MLLQLRRRPEVGFRRMYFLKFRVSVVAFVSIFMIAPILSLSGRFSNYNSGSGALPDLVSNIKHVRKMTGFAQMDISPHKREWEGLTMNKMTVLPEQQRTSAAVDKKSLVLERDSPREDVLWATSVPSLNEIIQPTVERKLPTLEKRARLLKEVEEIGVKVELRESRGARNRKMDNRLISDLSTPSNRNSRRPDAGKAPDFLVRTMKDQITMARVYSSIAHGRNHRSLLQDLKLQIRECQHVLGEAKFDNALPRSASERIRAMAQVLVRAQEQRYDYILLVRKLRAMLQSAEDYTRILKKQASYLSQLAIQTVPKYLTCISLRLSVHYNSLPMDQRDFPDSEKLEDPSLYHYAIFSDNVLAASVVVNSTIVNAREPERHVFHLVTDRLNFWAMKMWFLMNPPGNATIQIECIESFEWFKSSYCAFIIQHGQNVKINTSNECHSSAASSGKYRNPKYMSVLNNLRFYLPQVYPRLNRIVFLDDDTVVQQDLSPLWSIDLQGKANAAVELCDSHFHRLNKYVDFSNQQIAKNFDPDACVWAYGMNLFDLEAWRKENLTAIYQKWLTLSRNKVFWKLGTLPPALITFYGKTHVLDPEWHQPGLGYNPDIEREKVKNAAVIHYSGNLKPWLDTGLVTYKSYWAKYVKYNHPFLQECNINP